MPMEGEKLWSYVSEALKTVKQNWRAIFRAKNWFFPKKKTQPLHLSKERKKIEFIQNK